MTGKKITHKEKLKL